jgi:hypothetical protein
VLEDGQLSFWDLDRSLTLVCKSCPLPRARGRHEKRPRGRREPPGALKTPGPTLPAAGFRTHRPPAELATLATTGVDGLENCAARYLPQLGVIDKSGGG